MGVKRRQIREAVVQFLYAAGAAGSRLPTSDTPSLNLLLEPLEERRIRAQARALLHLQQGRGNWIEGLEGLARRLTRIECADLDDTSLEPLREFLAAESSMRDCVESLQRELNGNKNPVTLGDLLVEARKQNQAARSAAARLREARPDFPVLEQIRDEALALIPGLPRYAESSELALGDSPSELPELKNCRDIIADITAAREAITGYTDAIGGNLQGIDTRIEDAVDNYTPERIDRIDRAILRLATYELLHTPEVPPAVVINEAIELAREFGTTESPRFVNGVLDRIRKSAAQGL